MSIERYLAPGEKVAYLCRRHPIVMLKPFIVWLVTILALGTLSVVVTQDNPIPFLDSVAFWIGLAFTLYLGGRTYMWWRDRYAITNQRVLLTEGVISIKVTAVSLSRITETSFSRSLLGRLLGYGDLMLDSAGEQLGLTQLRYLPKPEAVYRLVTSLLLRSREAPARRPTDPSEENTGPLPPVVL